MLMKDGYSLVPEEVPREYFVILPSFDEINLPDLEGFICNRTQLIYKETVNVTDEAENNTYTIEKVFTFTCELLQFTTPNKIHIRYTIGKGMHSPTPDVNTIGQVYRVQNGKREFIEKSDELYFENSRSNVNQFLFNINSRFNTT